MSGHSVSNLTGTRAVLHGKLVANYGGTRVYEYDEAHYFVPEKLWKAIEDEAAKRAGQSSGEPAVPAACGRQQEEEAEGSREGGPGSREGSA